MKDGTIYAVKAEHSSNELYNISNDFIQLSTDSDLVHCGQIVDDAVYDDTFDWVSLFDIKSGVRKRAFVDVDFSSFELYEFSTDLTYEETIALRYFWEWQLAQKSGYGVGRLLSLSVVYPTRAFWHKIGWIPFENSMREVCSTAISEAAEFINRPLIPGESDETFVPGDIRRSPILRRIQ